MSFAVGAGLSLKHPTTSRAMRHPFLRRWADRVTR
jgi:hypothetical protein